MIGISISPATPETFIRLPKIMRFGKRIESQLPIVDMSAAKRMKLSATNSRLSAVRSRKMIAFSVSSPAVNATAIAVMAMFLPSRILRRSIGARISVRMPPSSKANPLHESPARTRNT